MSARAATVLAGHPCLREVARRDGAIRYAWTGRLTVDSVKTGASVILAGTSS